MSTAINNNIYTAGGCRILWRRLFSVPKEVKKVYKEKRGKRFSTKAMRTDPSLFPWNAAGPLQAVSSLEKEETFFAALNREAIGIWSQSLTAKRNFEADFYHLLETEDFHLAVISPDTSQEAAEIIDLLHYPLGGMAAYKIKGEVVLLVKNLKEFIKLLKSSGDVYEIGLEKIKKGQNVTPESAPSSVQTSAMVLKVFAAQIESKMEFEKDLAELERHAILTTQDKNFRPLIIKGDGWEIECSIYQDGLWDLIEPATKRADSLTVKEFKKIIGDFKRDNDRIVYDILEGLEIVILDLKEMYQGKKIIAIRLGANQEMHLIGDIHANQRNLDAVFKFHKNMKLEQKEKGKEAPLLGFAGDYKDSSGEEPHSNIYSHTQCLKTLRRFIQELVLSPQTIRAIRGNHDYTAGRILNSITKDTDFHTVPQGRRFVDFISYFEKGEECKERLEELFSALPWVTVILAGSKCTVFSHSFTGDKNGTVKLAKTVIGLINENKDSTDLPAEVTEPLFDEKGDMLNKNEHMLFSRSCVDPKITTLPVFAEMVKNEAEGINEVFFVFGHLFDRFAENQACYKIYDKNNNLLGEVLQSFLPELTLIKISGNGEVAKITIREAQK